MNNIKLVVSDLDETLLNSRKEVTEYTQYVIQKIVDAGIEFVPNSSRPISNIPEWFRKHSGIHYIVTANGSTIINNQTNETLISNTLTLSKAKEIICKGEPINPYWTLVINGEFYSHQKIVDDAKPLEITGKYLESVLRDRIIKESKDFLNDFPEDACVGKIHFITKDPVKKQELIEAMTSIEDIYIGSSAEINIEITNPGATKGKAVLWIMDQLKYTKDEVIVCGDNVNDLTMFEVAEHGIAVENATDQIKALAKYRALHHDCDGTAKMLHRLLFEE